MLYTKGYLDDPQMPTCILNAKGNLSLNPNRKSYE